MSQRMTRTTPDQLRLHGGASANNQPTKIAGPKKPGAKTPGAVTKAVKYTKAVARWIRAGRPTRSPEQIAAILAICQACEHYEPQQQACGVCKCRCNKKPQPLANMIAMATEHCKARPRKW